MKYIKVLILFLIFVNVAKSQNYIYFGDKQYESTETWSFGDNRDVMIKNMPEITIAKKGNGGYLMMSISASHISKYLTGTIIIFLNNGETIKCYDKGIKDLLNERSMSLYTLTNSEIEQLKSARINQIRYSVKTDIRGIGKETESYTAINSYSFGRESKTYETEKAVIKLFGR